ncbi:MAG: hypothetical protein QOD62_1764 [Actinomycetota bacterium]|nr:hypothetical protein [Actinomycetota bacterium]
MQAEAVRTLATSATPRQPGLKIGRGPVTLAVAMVLVAANLFVLARIDVPWITPALGLAGVVGIPTLLLALAGIWTGRPTSERLGICLVLTLLSLILIGLLINTALPALGVVRPLGTVPAVVLVDALCGICGFFAYRRRRAPFRLSIPSVGGRDVLALTIALALPALAVLGAIRLNNGAGGGLTLLALVLALTEMSLLLLWRDRLHPGVVPLAIYGVSLALLFMTSLRGWYTTGHDVQREYHVFELTRARSVWSISAFRDAYNACLSITILPTLIQRWTRVSDPYVYKVFFQMLFALCPVLVYRLASRVSSRTAALLGVIFFVSFVTFFQDMPMLNRQEIAFLFLVAGILSLFDEAQTLRARRLWFCVFGVGMVLSHYSTTYVTIGVLAFTWAIRVAMEPARRIVRVLFPRLAHRATPPADQRGRYVIGLGTVGFIALCAFVWSTPVTRTESGLSKTVTDAVAALRGRSGAEVKSSDVAYSILSQSKASPAQRLVSYDKESVGLTAKGRTAGRYYNAATLSRYPTPIAADQVLPLTSLGRTLGRLGLNVAAFNATVRQGSAKLLQILILVGLVAVLLGRQRSWRPPPEFSCLAVANLIVVLLQLALPVLTVNYGLLRAFQQSLVILQVFLAAGCLVLLPGRAGRWRVLVAGVAALAFFASSTGILTQMLGGYGPQLHLNNAGTYYDIYYLHPEETTAIAWLQQDLPSGTGGEVQSEVQADRYNFSKVQSLSQVSTFNDIYPSLIRRDAYVFLGYSNVRRSTSTISFAGDLITYHYPLAFLDDNKDLIYSNGGARVYR